MKKYLLTMATMILFAIGFIASDEEQKNSQSKSMEVKVEKDKNTSEPKKEEIVEEKKKNQIKRR